MVTNMARMEVELEHVDAEEAQIRCVTAQVGNDPKGVYLQLKMHPTDAVPAPVYAAEFPDFEGVITPHAFRAYLRMLDSFARTMGW